MTEVTHVAAPPPKPLLLFDGDCNFCRRWLLFRLMFASGCVMLLSGDKTWLAYEFNDKPGEWQRRQDAPFQFCKFRTLAGLAV